MTHVQTPTILTAEADANVSHVYTREIQRLVLVGNAPAAPAPAPPPSSPEVDGLLALPSPPPPFTPEPSLPPSPEPSPPPPGAPPLPPPPATPPPGSSAPLSGELLLRFNGEQLASDNALDLHQLTQIALGYAPGDAAEMVKGALESLSVVSVVGVTMAGALRNESAGTVRPGHSPSPTSHQPPPATHPTRFLTPATPPPAHPHLPIGAVSAASAAPATSPPSPGQVTLLFDVEFHHGELVPSPLNLGSMPLIALDTSLAHGALLAETTVQQAGSAPPNMSFPEFKVELNASTALLATLEGGMRLSFDNATTELLPPDASATQVRVALQALPTVGEIEVFRTQSSSGLAWLVRFYAVGEPAHIGPQPPLLVDASNLTISSARRRLAGASVSSLFAVATESAGESPFDPADSSEEALLASSGTSSDEAAANGTANEVSARAIAFVQPVHVCGNGIRSTAEACDDNNTASGDGCSALCQIEAGFACTSTADVDGGSGIGGLDTCAPICGDGKNIPWSTLDECDDNNTVSGDGCSADCLVEAGYACSGGSMTAKDTCASVCGDGLRVGAESCDDGNSLSLDGCSASCGIEAGYTCSGGSANSSDTCVACHASCATCSGPASDECVTCATSHPFFSAPPSAPPSAPGTCLASCLPVAKYADGSNVCQPCDAACGTCSGPASSDCLSCTSTSTPFLHNGTCVAECPSNGTYSGAIGSVAACLACDSTCATCGGPGSTDCVSCPASGTPFFDAGSCVSACPSGKYADANKACVACDSSCDECSDGTATGCTACLSGATFDSGAGTCTYSCPIGQFLQDDGLTCANCDSTCRTCTAAGSCTSCDTGSAFPVYHSNACISVCPDGTYADSSSRCQACDASCATCLGGTAADCIACDSAKPYKHGSTCLASCPTGSYAGGNSECATCDGSCAECDGPSASNCTACPTFAPFLHDGACLSACPSTHYAASASTCGACDGSCVTCSGPGSSACLSCPPATPHLVAGACTCMAGYQATSDACTQIDECATGAHNCFGGAAHCTDLAGSFSCACPAGYTGDGVSCSDVDECAAGTALCSPQATCANAPPSPAAPLGYTCTCNTTGYWGDGFFCGDVDECTLETALPTTSPHTCHPTARCINLDGAFECACASGYRAYYGVSGYHNETVARRL